MARIAVSSDEGCISADVLYTLPELKRRLGLGDAALRSARRRGLKMTLIGRRKFVLGRYVLHYVESLSAASSEEPS